MLLLLASASAADAWFADGQTWLIFDLPPDAELASLYADEAEVTAAEDELLVARAYPEDYRASRLDETLANELVTGWVVPDGQGGTRTLDDDEGLFVVTPTEAGQRHYAVLVGDELQPLGPVTEAVEPVTAHLQTRFEEEAWTTELWAHWADGRPWGEPGRDDYPPMGNADMNGLPHLFAAYVQGEPEGGPLVGVFYGGKLTPLRWNPAAPDTYDLGLDDGVTVVFDDGFHTRSGDAVVWMKTKGLGAWSDFDRFVDGRDTLPPDDAVVVPWTVERFLWEVDWLVEHYALDDDVSLVGHSDGGGVAGLVPRAAPHRFSTQLLLVPQTQGPPDTSEVTRLLGSPDQSLAQALWPGVTSQTVFDPATALVEGELGPTTVIVGRNDIAHQTAWSADRVAEMEALEAAGTGFVIDWDERVHSAFDPHQQGAWLGTERHGARYLATFDRGSFPAFVGDDQDLELDGRQPDMGDGDPEDGDPWGTWGGYHRYDEVDETEQGWSATLWLEEPPFEASRAEVVLRRLSTFAPADGETLVWRYGDQAGELVVDGDVRLPALTFTAEKATLRIGAPGTLDTGAPDSGAADSGVAPGDGCGCSGTGGGLWLAGLAWTLRRRSRSATPTSEAQRLKFSG